MHASTSTLSTVLSRLFAELTEGTFPTGGFVLNSDDIGLLRSLDRLSAHDASSALAGGATVAGHTEHLRYGLSLMNQWSRDGGNPFASARWDDAWRVHEVDDIRWAEIRRGLGEEVHRWRTSLETARDLPQLELSGVIGSVAHVAYHLGAIRQIAAQTRGPREDERVLKHSADGV